MSEATVISPSHRSTQCPQASARNAAPRGAPGPPPAPCWTCELIRDIGANHRGDECEVAAQRLQNRQCTLCGSSSHWKKACDSYKAEKHTPRKPTTTYFPTGPKRANVSGCLHCGTKNNHCTIGCKSANPPIILPTGQDKEDLAYVCKYFGVRGHGLRECMRCAPIQAGDNRSVICALTTPVNSLQKSVDNMASLSEKVTSLEGNMCSLLK